NMPAVGDSVQITGVLNITDKFGVSMFLQIPERLQVLEKFQMKEIKLGELKKENIDEIVKVKVHVISVSERVTKKGTKMYNINLGDETGKIGMTLFEAGFQKLPDEIKQIFSTPGTEFETAIRIGEFRGEFQAAILDYLKIKKLGVVEITESELDSAGSGATTANVKSINIGDLNQNNVNNIYKVKAGITLFSKKKTKKGKDLYLLELTDKTGSINVTIFDGDYNAISEENKKNISTEGNEIEVVLKISEYRGKIQANIADVTSIKKVGTVAVSKKEENSSSKYKQTEKQEDAQLKKIGELTLADAGKSVKIEKAEVKFVSSNDKGLSLTLDDGTGKIKIMIWENMLEKIPGMADIEKGASLSGIFTVDEYKEKLQLKIKNPKSIKIE
ncbi:hypothetical protein KA977_07040, partial [Candidatus Dependentiae bacterium]|nr:hypothetical protein [Candidatus Dependentiae bacterium]